MCLEHLTLSVMQANILLTLMTAERPPTPPAPGHWPARQSGVAHQTHWPGVVVWPHGGRPVYEYLLSSGHSPGSHQQSPTPLMVLHCVGQGGGGGAGGAGRAGGGGTVVGTYCTRYWTHGVRSYQDRRFKHFTEEEHSQGSSVTIL